MQHNFYIPHTAYLKSVISAIWQVNGPTPFRNETIIPKGVIEVIFNFSENVPIQATLANKQFNIPNCFINGFNTSVIHKQLPAQQVNLGIQFHPAAIKKYFGVPAHEFFNVAIDLSLVNKPFHSLWNQLAEQPLFNQRVSIIIQSLQEKIVNIHQQEKFLDSFLGSDHSIEWTVAGLSRSACYSPRHLSRKIYELTGMNAEMALLYKKYLHAMRLMHQHKLSLTAIAYQSNFSDQSHFIKTFRSFAQITPGEYRRKMSPVPGHIFENVR